MKKRIKVAGKYQRRYTSGILMYRERKNLVEVPAGSTVQLLTPGPKDTLVQLKDGFMVKIPNDRFAGTKVNAETNVKKPRTRRTSAAVAAAV